jgi:hypothetical protein
MANFIYPNLKYALIAEYFVGFYVINLGKQTCILSPRDSQVCDML